MDPSVYSFTKAFGIIGRERELLQTETARDSQAGSANMSAIGALRQLEKEKNKDPSKGGFKVRVCVCFASALTRSVCVLRESAVRFP